MTELCKLMFDLALYYAITGYFTVLIFNEAPSPVGFLFLLAVILVDSLLRRHRKEMRVIQFCFLLLPFAAALSKPGLCQILQALPAWLYIGWCIVTDRVEIDYIGFKDHFGFVLRLQALLLFGIPFWSRIPTAFLQAVPYLVLMLADGVCVMRMLRENRPNSFDTGCMWAVLCCSAQL